MQPTGTDHSDSIEKTPLKRWEEPRITVERNLQVAAQGGPGSGSPDVVPGGFVGPLATSGGGVCL